MLARDFGYWLAGFIDGEGCFFISRHHKNDGRWTAYKCQFQIRLRADDAAILAEIRARLGFGAIKPDPRRGSSNPSVRFLANTKPQVVALVAVLDVFPLRAKKARDYAIWREAVALWTGFTKAGGNDLAEMERLRTRLMAGRQFEPLEIAA